MYGKILSPGSSTSGAVGDGVRARQLHHMAGLREAFMHAGVSGLDANDLDMRVQQLGQRRYAVASPPPPMGTRM